MSLSRELCWSNVVAIVDRLALTEVHGPATTERTALTSPMVPDPVGSMRLWRRCGVAWSTSADRADDRARSAT